MESLNESSKLIAQRKLSLPLWIKGFGWLFVIMGALSLPTVLFTEARLGIFGISSQGNGLNFDSIITVSIYLFMGIAAFGLYQWN